jgi:uncharacterized membrane protein
MSSAPVAVRDDEGSGRLPPEWLFAIFALLGGLVLIALIPPVAGGNERYNFQRAAGAASGHFLVEPAMMPGGMSEFLEVSRKQFPEGRSPPYSYSKAEFDALSSIPLRADAPAPVRPNPIAVLHPVSYLPQVPAIAIGQALGLSPLASFYIGRVAGLLAGVALTFYAIRAIPMHKHALAAVALLPPILFSRSTLDADQLTNGLAFLFVALVVREIGGGGRIRGATLAALAVSAFILAQAKSAYLLLPLLSLAIPAGRFGSTRAKLLACALIIVPGALASVGWMIALKLTYFDDLQYRTWSGVVRPDEQLRLILSHPLDYAEVLLRTLFATPFIPKVILDFLGVFGPPVSLPIAYYPVAALLLTGVIASGRPIPEGALRNWRTRALAVGIAIATLLLILTLLYLQWTRYQAPVVEGFNGRYLYPLAPLLLLALPTLASPFLGIAARWWLLSLAILSLAATWLQTWVTYLA